MLSVWVALQVEGAVSVADRSPSIWDNWAATPGHVYHNETRTALAVWRQANLLRWNFVARGRARRTLEARPGRACLAVSVVSTRPVSEPHHSPQRA